MARKKTLTVGARVLHASDETLNEGVVVHISENPENICVKRDTPYSVHWRSGQRGHYSFEDISRIPTTSTVKEIKEEVLSDETE